MQKDDGNDDFRRTRFHASAITTRETPAGTEFVDIPDVVVIYITEYDLLGNGQVFTKQRHCVENADKWSPIEDGEYIYYANTVCKDDSDKSELLQLLASDTVIENNKFKELSKAVKYYKKDKEGVTYMCKLVEEYAEEYVEEYKEASIKRALKIGLNIEQISETLGISCEQVLAIQKGQDEIYA